MSQIIELFLIGLLGLIVWCRLFHWCRRMRRLRGRNERLRRVPKDQCQDSCEFTDLDAQIVKQRASWRSTRAKPIWVGRELVKLKALMPKAGCRVIAEAFNRRFAVRYSESVSYSTVRRILIQRRAEVPKLKLQLHNRRPWPLPRNRTWAIDLPTVADVGKRQHVVLGVIDHGSRACLALSRLADKRSLSVLIELVGIMRRFGVPKQIRVDNEATLVSMTMRLALGFLGIKIQCIAPMSPWQNGRIERFFGTLKAAIRQITVTGVDDLRVRLIEFRAFYNQVRPHQNLDGRTPAEAWEDRRKGFGEGEFVSLWSGVLCGWYFPKRE